VLEARSVRLQVVINGGLVWPGPISYVGNSLVSKAATGSLAHVLLSWPPR